MNDIVRISSVEFQKNPDRYEDVALTRPVTITRDGEDRTVLISAAEYSRLKRRDRRVMGLADFTADDVAAIERATAPDEAARFDHEVP